MDHDLTKTNFRQARLRPHLLNCFLLAVLFLLPSLAAGQSCALCYTQAASSGQRMIKALRSGILILVVPPTLMSLGVVVVAYVKRNQCRRIETDAEWEDFPDEGFEQQGINDSSWLQEFAPSGRESTQAGR